MTRIGTASATGCRTALPAPGGGGARFTTSGPVGLRQAKSRLDSATRASRRARRREGRSRRGNLGPAIPTAVRKGAVARRRPGRGRTHFLLRPAEAIEQNLRVVN